MKLMGWAKFRVKTVDGLKVVPCVFKKYRSSRFNDLSIPIVFPYANVVTNYI